MGMDSMESELNSEKFKNLLEVVQYLQASGWKVTKSTVYRHRDQGKLGPLADGFFERSDIDRYARDWLKRLDGSGSDPGKSHQEQNAKSEAETRKVSAQAEHWEIKTKILRGEYVERSAFERALARRAAVFKSDIENFIRNNSGEMIALVAGDATRSPDLIDYWLEHAEQWIDRYAEDKEVELPAGIDLQRFESA